MKCILTNGNNYCVLGRNGAIKKTNIYNDATIFESETEAEACKNKAPAKLKSYEIKTYNEKIIQTTEFNIEKTEKKTIQKNKRIVFPSEIRNNVYNNSEGKCGICGKFVPVDEFTIDHIIPLSEGGGNEVDNLQCACKACNMIKQNMDCDTMLKKMAEIMAYQIEKNGKTEFWKTVNQTYRKNKYKKMMNSLKEFLTSPDER